MLHHLLRRSCLKSNNSLRYQVLISFGSISAVAILTIITAAIVTSIMAGHRVQSHAESTLRAQAIRTIRVSSESLADTVSRRSDSIHGAVSILVEATRDRLVGRNWETDDQVPFIDMVSGQRRYPLAPVFLPPDWNITVNIHEDDYLEHVGEKRSDWYKFDSISTAHATFTFQGQCDPSATEGDQAYYPNCTDANNDPKTCGVVRPVVSTLYEKVGFLQYILKPLFETHSTIRNIGVYFFNDGAGASVSYPAAIRDGRASYTSIGCNWMLDNVNTYTGLPFATVQQVARCHQEGEEVPGREYNPLERQWCRDQALAGGAPVISGPYVDAFREDVWLLAFGRGIFDRITGEFIACCVADVSVNYVGSLLNELVENSTHVSMVRWSDGNVIAEGGKNRSKKTTSFNISDIGLSQETFDEIKSLISPRAENDHGGESDNIYTDSKGSIVAAYPIPPAPENPDQNYQPQLILLTIIDVAEVFQSIEIIGRTVNDSLLEIIVISSLMGLSGFLLVLCLTWLVSRWLTSSLQWMEAESRRIVYSEVDISIRDKPSMRWTPKTEVTTLVTGFGTMIQGFSGNEPCRVAQDAVYEIENTLERKHDFHQLYCVDKVRPSVDENLDSGEPQLRAVEVKPPKSHNRRAAFELPMKEVVDIDLPLFQDDNKNKRNDACALTMSDVDEESKKDQSQKRNARIHCGLNLQVPDSSGRRQVELRRETTQKLSIRRSPLVWWIAFLIVIPLLLTIFAISGVVSSRILVAFPGLVASAKDQSLQLAEEHVRVMTKSRAQYAGDVLLEVARDLHLYRRFSEWLLLGVIERNDAFTEVTTATERCKRFSDDFSCPFFQDKDQTPCDCEWNDIRGVECQNYRENSRYFQRRFWASQRHNADVLTGDRSAVEFPFIDISPEKTSWWDNVTEVPGSESGENSSGYNTAYDRVRVLSAVAIVEFPIYNYAGGWSERAKYLGTHVGLAADGMVSGFSGCDFSFAQFAHFESTAANGAAAIRGDLCPLGKFGFDPRCRGWYADGKALDRTHTTAPYLFADGKTIGISMTEPLYDTIAEAHIGQAVLHFDPDALLKHLSGTRVGLQGKSAIFVITPSNDVFGGDTIVAPNYILGNSTTASIKDLVLPNDEEGSDFRTVFGEIVGRMKAGEAGSDYFSRTLESGQVESLYLAFGPVRMEIVKTLNGSDFARGVAETDSIVYLFAIAMPRATLIESSDGDLDHDLWVLLVVFLFVSIATASVTTFFTFVVAVEIATPVMILSSIVAGINAGHIDDDIPPIDGGSREVNHLYHSFATLSKIIRLSNTAFFSGNIEWALKFLTDALILYRNVDDKKAIGVALNNLGNAYLSLYLTKGNPHMCCFNEMRCVKVAAHLCYCEAIEGVLEDYENSVNNESVDDEERAELAQQLANRYFNRGIFLLLTVNDPCAPKNSGEMARKDLRAASRLDMDVRDFWVRTRQVKSNSEYYFDRLIRRVSGLLSCPGDDSIDVEELLNEADNLLGSIGKDDQAPLFQQMTRIGRLQQLEEVAIRNELKRGRVDGAVRYAVRMFVEDEYLIESAFVAAADAILLSMSDCNNINWTPETVDMAKDHFCSMHKVCRSPVSLQVMEKSIIFSLDANLGIDKKLCRGTQEGVNALYAKICNHNDRVGLAVFACAESEALGFNLTEKSPRTLSRLANLPVGTAVPILQAALSDGVLQALSMVESSRSTTWIVVVTECQSWSDHREWDSVQAAYASLTRHQPVHLLVVGIDLSETMISSLRSICRSQKSALIETKGDEQSMLAAFAEVASIIGGGVTLRGFGMEKF